MNLKVWLPGLLLAVAALPAQAVTVRTNITGDFGLSAPLGGGATPGAAFVEYAAYAAGTRSRPLNSGDRITSGIERACASVVPTVCEFPARPVTLPSLSPLPGLGSSFTGRAGNDLAAYEFAIASSGSAAGSQAIFEARSGEAQLLRFSLDGLAPDTPIEVDVAYSLGVVATDNSSLDGSDNFYNLRARAAIFIADSTTYDGVSNPDLSVAIPFFAFSQVQRGNVGAATDGFGKVEDSGAGVATMTVFTERLYFVALQSDHFFEAVGDMAGLNLSVGAFSDPVFSLNPQFAAASLTPEAVASFTAQRTTVVPVPAAGWLLLSALGAGGALVRRRVA